MRSVRSLAILSVALAAIVAALIFTPALAGPPDPPLPPAGPPPGVNIAADALPPEGTNDGVGRAREILAGITARLIPRDDVVGTGLGLTDAGGPLIKVYLKNAGGAGIPAEVGGFPVEVEVVGEIFARPHTIQRYRPAPIGVSTGHPNITAGTIACRVLDDGGTNDPADDMYFALSNNHVYADTNAADPNDAVIQPGTFDGGSSPSDDIGTLFDFEPIKFDGTNNTIDAAIALSSPADVGTRTLCDGYGLPKSTTVVAAVRMKVQKYGRTTGQTAGRVDATNATVDVNYGGGLIARFVGQIVITPGNFSAGGDSGSLIVVRGGPDDRSPVGLLFAGSFFVTIANPIDDVLAAFDVTVDDTPEPETNCDDGVDNDCDGFIDCDDLDCTGDPACGGGCVGDGDCAPGDICCGGTCTTPVCSGAAECDDGDTCTTDTCTDAGTCAAACSNTFPGCGVSDGCCGPDCTPATDVDCAVCTPANGACGSNEECCSGKCREKGKKAGTCTGG